MTDTALCTKLRNDVAKRIFDLLTNEGEDVMFIKDGVICFPVVDSEQNERWVRLPIEIPKGTRNPDKSYEPFDGYAEAENYEFEKAEKARKVAEAKAKKEKKIEADRKYREAKAKIDARVKERRGE